MLGTGLTSSLFAIGFGCWVYVKLERNTRNQQRSLIGGAVAGGVGFIVLFTLMKFVLHF